MSDNTQTKLLSSATVLSTLGDNDKIVVTTEAGNTGLVSKDTLKSEMGLAPVTETAATAGQWIRVVLSAINAENQRLNK